MSRPRSWREVPAANPSRGARGNFRPGGLAAWRSIGLPERSSGGRRSGGGNDDLRGQATRAIEDDDKGLNPFNAGGRALLGALDLLDTPRAFVAATAREINEIHDYDRPEGLGGLRQFSAGDIAQGTRDNITSAEALGTSAGVLGFAVDVAMDPLNLLTGGGARVGVEAGKPAARALLRQSTKDFLGEAATVAAEKGGVKFADDAARQAFVREQGETLAARAAQKALKFRSNQALSPLEREAIGATPGTFIKIPGSKKLGVDKAIERIVGPSRVYDTQTGHRAFQLTKREMGLGRLAGKGRAKLTQSAFGNRIAETFTKYPDLRKKILFGTPDEAAVAFHGMEEMGAGQLQRRLTESVWGDRMGSLLQRAKKAGVDGTDLRYAIAEAVDEGEEAFAGDSTSRILAQISSGKVDDPNLLDDFRAFFRDIRDHVNNIDPELPWLQLRQNWTVNLPSDEAIALRGAWNAPGGQLRREAFDFRQKYGLEPDQIDTFMDQKLLPPADAGGRSVRQQIDDILSSNNLDNLFETDAYKAFPDYVRRISKRYGDEFMAKRLRDLGIAEPGWVMKLTERGMSQGKAKAAIQSLQLRASVRAAKERQVAADARSAAIASEGNLGASQGTLDEVRGDKARYEGEKAAVAAKAGVLDPDGVREYEALLRDQSEVLAMERQGLLDTIDMADVNQGLMGDAEVALGQRISRETHDAYERITALEMATYRMEEELAELYDRMYLLQEGVTPEGIRARQALDEMERNERQIVEVTERLRAAEELLIKFEDVANMPTEHLDAQLTQIDEMLTEAVEQYKQNPEWAGKVNTLADLKASALHEKYVIERARGRVADLDRSDPAAWIDELDDLQNQNALSDLIVHTIFPQLPAEVHGSRIRQFFQARMPQLEAMIDDTQDQILSAFWDRDTMTVQLGKLRAQRREAQRQLRRTGEAIQPRMREIFEAQEELLSKADAAATRALEIDAELEQAREAVGILDESIGGLAVQEKVAEMFVAQQSAKHAHYEGIAAAAEHKASNAKRVEDTWNRIAKDNLDKPQEMALASALNSQYRQLGAVSMVKEDWLVDGLRAAAILNGPKALAPIFKSYDRILNLWKAYALSTPGSVMRNMFGGVFNNYLAGGVDTADYRKTMLWLTGGRGLSDADKAIFQQLEDAGLLVSSGSILEVERRAAGIQNLNPLSTDNRFVQTFRRGQENVESMVRGSLAFSTLRQGGDINDAIGKVVKYHFDYDDLSSIERSVFRRIVPFYTWTRKNLPLMLEQIVQNPAKFTKFYQLKNEIELQSPEETVVPSYFAENLAMRLPFTLGGDRAYMLPDLPFTALNDVSDPTMAFSQVSPFIKSPIEYAFGKQFFKGIPLKDEYRPVPRMMTAVPGLMEGLDAVGIAQRGPNGWSMTQKDLYMAESFLPTFGKARRLFPSEEQYSERVLSAWLSFAFGAGIRANTPTDQRNEAYRRIYSDLENAESRRELGYADYGYNDEGEIRNPPSAYSLYESYFNGESP